jgi:hypothetical protein
MPKTPAVFSPADRIRNPTYGLGTIKHVDAQYTTILFDEHGTKKFLTDMVHVEHTDVPARTKPGRSGSPKAKPSAK